MNRAIKFHPLAVGVMLACGASLTYAEPALEEVTVTAQKREQSLQEVPVAVTAIGEAALIENGIADITDIQKLSPNTTLQVGRGTNSTLTAFIRGIGQQDPLWGFEPGVGIYIDDIYIARPQGAVMDVYDVASIEVLRGPQGTLYGKNTIGGAVKYVTKKMTGEPGVSISGALGSFNQRDFKLSASTALSDSLNIGAAVASFQRDGYGENVVTGKDHYNKDVLSGRVSVEFSPNDSLFVRFAADKTRDESASKHGHRFGPGFVGEAVLDSIYDTETNLPSDNLVETSGMSLSAEYQISDNVTIKSITASREGSTETVIDFDSTQGAWFDVPAFYDDEQFTQEFQLLWEGDNADLVSGIYYYDGTAAGAFDAVLGFAAPGGFTQNVAGTVDTTSLSAYAHYNWQFAEAWNLNVGGRYTRDEKSAVVFKGNYLGFGSDTFHDQYYAGTPDPIFLGALTDYTGENDWAEFSPRIGVDYQLNNDVMLYAAYSAGFKSGGFDMRGDASVNPETVDGYDPETVDTVELGWKMDLLDNRLRLNGALFRADYTDMQVTTQTLVPGGGFASAVLNAGESRIQGLELEASLAVTDNLSANAVIGLVDAEFVEFIERGVDVSDELAMQNTPDTTAMFQLNWSLPVAGGEMVVIPSVSYRADTQIFERPGILDQDAYTLVDLTATYYSGDGSWNLGLQGKNLTDKEYRIAGYDFGAPFQTGFYGNPRTIALTGNYNF
ncbi:TonB-dependent receptor [Microbulbifer marinus]|uniref:Iron complex outermembrane recepter protein n=1 Tax=Microbulbifer marinus TaxID=658218 RepID=A0A1H3YP51_9GAMM|nr:TonB-dependent receptor [Microbulbifer marinus]SEA13273.1 iron complex outermembrane recepter protein [Microbulbifer marinus]